MSTDDTLGQSHTFADDIQRKQELIEAYKRRKHVRQMQAARYGPSSDPSIMMEIEDIDIIIRGIESDLQELHDAAHSKFVTRVLVVDDDALTLDFTRRTLKTLKYSVDHASDGLEALDKVINNKYDIVLLDYQLPKLDGLQVLTEMSKRRIPTRVVMITAFATFQNAVKCMKLGACNYITKPISHDDLIIIIRLSLLLEPTLDDFLNPEKTVSQKLLYRSNEDTYRVELMTKRLIAENEQLLAENTKLQETLRQLQG